MWKTSINENNVKIRMNVNNCDIFWVNRMYNYIINDKKIVIILYDILINNISCASKCLSSEEK